MCGNTIVLFLAGVCFLIPLTLYLQKVDPGCPPMVEQDACPSPSPEPEKEMLPEEFIDVTVTIRDNNTATFRVWREERERLDIGLVHYDNKMFEDKMTFVCSGSPSIIIFTNSILCNPSFVDCEKATLIFYENRICSDSFDSSMLNRGNFPKAYNFDITGCHFSFDGCIVDETKEFVVGERSTSELFSLKEEEEILRDEHCKRNDQGEIECFYPFQEGQKLEYKKKDGFETFEFKTTSWDDLFKEEQKRHVADMMQPSKEQEAIPLGPDEEECDEVYGNGCKRNKKTGVHTIFHPKDGRWFEEDLEFVKPEKKDLTILGPDEEECEGLDGDFCKRNKKTGVVTMVDTKNGIWFEENLEFVEPEENDPTFLGPDEEEIPRQSANPERIDKLYGNFCKFNKKTGVVTRLRYIDGRWHKEEFEPDKPETAE